MYTEEKNVLTENQIARDLFQIAKSIHIKYGQGFEKSFYKKLLFNRLTDKGMDTSIDYSHSCILEKIHFAELFTGDLLVEKKVLIYIVDDADSTTISKKSIVNHLKISGFKLALLICFNKPLLKDGFQRIVNNL